MVQRFRAVNIPLLCHSHSPPITYSIACSEAMAYTEICVCIRTLQEAAFQQESEIFRLREREAHLKQLVIELTEKLHIATGSKDAQNRLGSDPGLEVRRTSRDALNNVVLDSRGVAEAASPRQPLKVTISVGPAMQQQQQSAPMMEAIYDVITLDNMDPGAVLQPEEAATKGKKRHGTHTKTRGSMVDDQARRMTLLSSDMETNLQDRIVKTITLRYGDLERVQRAALCIQRAYRAYTLRKHYRILVRQGPAIMRRRTNTGVGAAEGKGAKRLSVMTIQGGPLPPRGCGQNKQGGQQPD
ncbi:hypothetical protein EMCRGX_G001330 [Ephydatia muelleri]